MNKIDYTSIKTLDGDCKGTIYINLMKIAAEIIYDPNALKKFANDLWKKLYDELFDSMHPIFLGINQSEYKWNLNSVTDNDYIWFRIYEKNGCQYVDKIKLIELGEILREDTCINAAYDIMLKEIQENMIDCRFITDAIIKMYDGLEHYNGVRYFYIIDEEHSALVTNNDSLDKWNIKYKFIDNNSGDITIKKYVNKKEN